VGKSKAKEMMLTGRTYTGAEALEMNLVNTVFPDDEFDASVAKFCADMLANSWHSLRGYKMLMMETDGMTLDEGLAYEVYNGVGVGPDMAERISGFVKK
jgi:enoyl-CoA hydratase/carnithine racemase